MIPCQRHLFDLPEDVAYLNCAYMSPLSKAVQEAGHEGIARKARPWAIAPPDFFASTEAGRAAFAALIGATPEDVAIVPAASYGIATAAANLTLEPGQRIVVLAEQFPSNLYAWRELADARGGRVVAVERPADGAWTPPLLAAIAEDTAIVATPHCHWTDGGLVDLIAVARRAREVGAALVVDLTQSAGALPFSIADVDPDFAVSACYKWLLGPYSLGFLYAAPRHHGRRPLEHNWMARRGSEDFARLVDYQEHFQPGARRFDVGESANFALMPMAVAAMRQLRDWGVDEVQATLREMTGRIAEEARALGLVADDPQRRAGHFVGLRFPGGPPAGLLAALEDRQVHVSVRGDCLRVTPHVYNSEADIERLMQTLRDTL